MTSDGGDNAVTPVVEFNKESIHAVCRSLPSRSPLDPPRSGLACPRLGRGTSPGVVPAPHPAAGSVGAAAHGADARRRHPRAVAGGRHAGSRRHSCRRAADRRRTGGGGSALRVAVARDRPGAHQRSHRRHRRRGARARHPLRRHRHRRHVEDDQPGCHLGSGLRKRGHGVAGLGGRGSFQPQRRVVGLGRDLELEERLLGRRRLPVGRRRQELDA